MELCFGLITQNLQRGDLAGFQAGNLVEHISGIIDRLTADFQQDVTRFDACPICRAAAQHSGDQDAAAFEHFESFCKLWRDVLYFHPNPATLHPAVKDNLFHYLLGEADRDGEADPQGSPATGIDCAVDTDQVATSVYQRTSGIPRG